MSKVAIMTDSNSGITQQEAKELGVSVLPMPFYIGEDLFFEDISLTQEAFYEKLEGDAEIHTSQPSPGDILNLWEDLLEQYDEIVHIPMSSGLSGSCETAAMLAQDFDGRVQVVNNKGTGRAGEDSKGNQTHSGTAQDGFQHLYYGRYIKVSEKGRQSHTGRCSARNIAAHQASIGDSG